MHCRQKPKLLFLLLLLLFASVMYWLFYWAEAGEPCVQMPLHHEIYRMTFGLPLDFPQGCCGGAMGEGWAMRITFEVKMINVAVVVEAEICVSQFFECRAFPVSSFHTTLIVSALSHTCWAYSFTTLMYTITQTRNSYTGVVTLQIQRSNTQV